MIQSVVKTDRFWSDLPWEPGGKELYKFIKQNKFRFSSISFLTAPLKSDPRCVSQKQEWIMTNFKNIHLDAFYADSKKWDYVGKQEGELQILIDDRPKNISKWKANSGFGILHNSKNYESTISKLKELF